ncbi:MAG: membrane protein insertase YidC [Candidatus Nanopelagicales bacterium]
MFLWEWLQIAVSWILVMFHQLFSAVWGDESGWAWVWSIVGLVVVIRIMLIPLFVKQIRAQRNLQAIQPQLKELQAKHAGDRERLTQETMALYKESGTNPFSSCLPILLQTPVFFALFTVLQGVAMEIPRGVFKWEQYAYLLPSAHNAQIFGVPLYGTFRLADQTPNPTATRVLALILIVLMSVTTFITQRQLLLKNTASDNPIAQQMKIMMYVFPIMFAIGGLNFPIGVLIYWFTTNIWTMGQQFWVIRNNPQPGTPAAIAAAERKARKSEKKGLPAEPTGGASGGAAGGGSRPPVIQGEVVPDQAQPRQRNQPKRQSRAKRTGPPPKSS